MPPPSGRFRQQAGRSGSFVRGGQLRDFEGRFANGGVVWSGLEASQKYLEDVKRKTEAGAQRAMTREANAIELWMKASAPWEDRTGEARELLQAVVQFRNNRSGDEEQGVMRIYVGHGADHGVFLELGMGGRFQIIRPALERLRNRLPTSVVAEIESEL